MTCTETVLPAVQGFIEITERRCKNHNEDYFSLSKRDRLIRVAATLIHIEKLRRNDLDGLREIRDAMGEEAYAEAQDYSEAWIRESGFTETMREDLLEWRLEP